MKKVIVAIFLGLALTVLIAGTSQATWFTCTVDAVGVVQSGGTTVYAAYLTDTAQTPAFTQTYVMLNASCANQLLATLLTAQANGKKIWASVANNYLNGAYCVNAP